jgi:hypothetical protein
MTNAKVARIVSSFTSLCMAVRGRPTAGRSLYGPHLTDRRTPLPFPAWLGAPGLGKQRLVVLEKS